MKNLVYNNNNVHLIFLAICSALAGRRLQRRNYLKMDKDTRNSVILTYCEAGLNNKEIVDVLRRLHRVCLSERQVRRLLAKKQIRRRQFSSLEEVSGFVANELKGSGRLLGYRAMFEKCKLEGFSVRKEDVRIILQELDYEGVSARSSRRLIRRQYYVPGPNFIWHVDGNDKLVPFGIGISGCIDGFSRKLIWLNAYVTNKDPRIIGRYFLDAVIDIGGCPQIVRGDAGTENVNMRRIQEFLCSSKTDGRSVRDSYIEGASTVQPINELRVGGASCGNTVFNTGWTFFTVCATTASLTDSFLTKSWFTLFSVFNTG